jgi:hypothetical protein
MSGAARLARLYRKVEQMRSVERRVAAMHLDDVEVAASMARSAWERELGGGRAALARGDREGWTVAELAGLRLTANLERLAQLRVKREVVLLEAAERHDESRLKMEQVEKLVERRRAEAALEAGRREQAGADDRFGSRLAWVRLGASDD